MIVLFLIDWVNVSTDKPKIKTQLGWIRINIMK